MNKEQCVDWLLKNGVEHDADYYEVEDEHSFDDDMSEGGYGEDGTL